MKPSKQCIQLTIRAALLAGATSALFGCGGGKSEPVAGSPSTTVAAQAAPSNASKLCAFANDDIATKCQSGQIALFVPNSWGNEQYPVIYAAKYCDFNFPIVHTNGAVSCVFFKGRTVVQAETPAVPQTPASESASGS